MPTAMPRFIAAPGETYIWAMTFGKDGSLYLATGNHGKILRVPPTNSTPATAETYFETDETHITTLAWDKDGNLLAGTSPHGYLYRIDKTNHGFVLFNSGDTEIKQIAVAPNGTFTPPRLWKIPSRNRRPAPVLPAFRFRWRGVAPLRRSNPSKASQPASGESPPSPRPD